MGTDVMSAENKVFRYAVVAKPTKNHQKYFDWQTLDMVLFVGDTDGNVAEGRAIAFLKKQNVRIVEFKLRDQLIESKVLAAGDDIRDRYLKAKTGVALLAFQRVREFFSDKQSPPPQFPMLTEAFFDKVAQRAGGIRFPASKTEGIAVKSADYVIEDCIVELKFLLQDPY